MFEPVTITSTAVTTGWPVVCGMGVTSCADAALTEGRTPAMIARRKPVLARFFMAAHSCSAAREFSAKSCNNRMAAIIAEYLIIFKPLMESFSTGRRARLCRGFAQSRDATRVLEALLQCYIPGSPLNIGCLFVVAVFTAPGYDPGYEWRCQVEDVIHPKGDCCAIQPRSPTAYSVFRRRYWRHLFVLALRHLRVFATIFGIPGHFILRCRRREVKGIIEHPIQRNPFTDLATLAVLRGILKIPILADVVHDKAGIESSQR